MKKKMPRNHQKFSLLKFPERSIRRNKTTGAMAPPTVKKSVKLYLKIKKNIIEEYDRRCKTNKRVDKTKLA